MPALIGAIHAAGTSILPGILHGETIPQMPMLPFNPIRFPQLGVFFSALRDISVISGLNHSVVSAVQIPRTVETLRRLIPLPSG